MLNIRKMEERDRKDVSEMMKIFYASPAVMTNGSAEIFEKDITECINGSPYASGYIFEADNITAGYAMLAHSFSTEFGKRCIWVEDIYIKPEFRRLGIGKAFFEFLDHIFPGCVFRLEAERDNSPAVGLYKKSGFRELKYLEMIKHKK